MGGQGNSTSGSLAGYRTVNSNYTLASNYALLCIGYDENDKEFVIKLYQNSGSSTLSITSSYIQYWYVFALPTNGADGMYIEFYDSFTKDGVVDVNTRDNHKLFNIRDFNGTDVNAAAVYLDYRRYTIPNILRSNTNTSINWDNIYPVGDPMHS